MPKPKLPRDYTLIRPLSMGGVADVYVVLTPRHERRVYRTLKDKYRKDHKMRNQFTRGAEVLSRFHHPSVIYQESAGFDASNTPFMLLEYFESENLRKCIYEKSAVLTSHRLTILTRIAEGIAYIHDEGYFHFDIKPENILINDSGDVRVIDFDLVFERKKNPVHMKNFAGTHAYIAPEVIQFNQADETTDIYGLGVSAFEMITGAKPDWNGRTHEAVMKDLLRVCPKPLAEVVFKCLDPQPSARYPSMHLVLQDLKALV